MEASYPGSRKRFYACSNWHISARKNICKQHISFRLHMFFYYFYSYLQNSRHLSIFSVCAPNLTNHPFWVRCGIGLYYISSTAALCASRSRCPSSKCNNLVIPIQTAVDPHNFASWFPQASPPFNSMAGNSCGKFNVLHLHTRKRHGDNKLFLLFGNISIVSGHKC